MDAKNKANSINPVASGSSIPCPKCGTSNKPDAKFCISCGAEIIVSKEAQNSTPAFEPVKEASAKTVKYMAPSNAFARGLPDWSIEPPQLMVRRH